MSGTTPSEDPGATEVAKDETSFGSEDDFVHERLELPEWIPVAFGLILVSIAAAAIWMAS